MCLKLLINKLHLEYNFKEKSFDTVVACWDLLLKSFNYLVQEPLLKPFQEASPDFGQVCDETSRQIDPNGPIQSLIPTFEHLNDLLLAIFPLIQYLIQCNQLRFVHKVMCLNLGFSIGGLLSCTFDLI